MAKEVAGQPGDGESAVEDILEENIISVVLRKGDKNL